MRDQNRERERDLVLLRHLEGAALAMREKWRLEDKRARDAGARHGEMVSLKVSLK